MKLTTLVNGVERQLELNGRPASGEPCVFSLDGLESNADIQTIGPGLYSILLGARSFEAKIETGESGYSVDVGGHHFDVLVRDPRKLFHGGAGVAESGPQRLTAPMPGKVVRVLVEEGQAIESGQGLIVVEAMKMQNEIKSPQAGTVGELFVVEGQAVDARDPMFTVLPN